MTTQRQDDLLFKLFTICTEETQPGKTIPPQDVLAERFDVSRTSIREALSILEFLKLIKVRQKTGTVVNPPHVWLTLPEEFKKAKEIALFLAPKPEATLTAGEQHAAA